MCLRNDEEPYFRRMWRLGFIVACPSHGVILRDSCPKCGKPACPHRVSLDDPSLRHCYNCRANLSKATSVGADPDCLAFQLHLTKVLEDGYATIRNCRSLYAPLYFTALRRIARLLINGTEAQSFREEASRVLGRPVITPAASADRLEFETLAP